MVLILSVVLPAWKIYAPHQNPFAWVGSVGNPAVRYAQISASLKSFSADQATGVTRVGCGRSARYIFHQATRLESFRFEKGSDQKLFVIFSLRSDESAIGVSMSAFLSRIHSIE